MWLVPERRILHRLWRLMPPDVDRRKHRHEFSSVECPAGNVGPVEKSERLGRRGIGLFEYQNARLVKARHPGRVDQSERFLPVDPGTNVPSGQAVSTRNTPSAST